MHHIKGFGWPAHGPGSAGLVWGFYASEANPIGSPANSFVMCAVQAVTSHAADRKAACGKTIAACSNVLGARASLQCGGCGLIPD